MQSSTSSRVRYGVGATVGFAAGAGTSAAVGYGVLRVVGAVSRTNGAQTFASRAAIAAPRLVAALPVVGTGLAVGLSAYGLYQALKPAVAHAQAAAAKKKVAAARDTTGMSDADLKRYVGENFGSYEARLQKMIESDRDAAARYQKQGDSVKQKYHLSRQLSAQDALLSERQRETPAAPPPPPPPQSTWGAVRQVAGDIAKDVGGLFGGENPEIKARRDGLNRELGELQDLRKREFEGKGGSGKQGTGPKVEYYDGKIRETQDRLDKLAKEARDSNEFAKAFHDFAPVGAALAGLGIGGRFGTAAATKITEQAAKGAAAVDKIGQQAGKLLKSRPQGVLAGTPAGDKAKGLVNEAYARGGARPAFGSPGFPVAANNGGQLFATSGRAKWYDYAVPGMQGATGVASLAISRDTSQPEGLRYAERVIGGLEIGVAVGMTKSLLSAPVLRPAAAAVSAIEGLRNRLVREAATGAPAGVATARAAGRASLARIQSGRATSIADIRANAAIGSAQKHGKGRVAAAGISSKQPGIEAGARLGVAKARGAGQVSRAEAKAKLGPPKGYKDTWMDSRGRVYHRKDTSVRRGANDNAKSSKKKTG